MGSPTRKATRQSMASPTAASSSMICSNQCIPIAAIDDEWQWFCGDCMVSYGDEMCGLEVRVWWHGDACVYEGIFNAFDETSHCHRVLYHDAEWEFANFAQEVFMIRPKPANGR